jgi:DNA-binding beta-propeller fold protein YncE
MNPSALRVGRLALEVAYSESSTRLISDIELVHERPAFPGESLAETCTYLLILLQAQDTLPRVGVAAMSKQSRPGTLIGLASKCFAIIALLAVMSMSPTDAQVLALERSIELPGVAGRIDHLALDVEGARLFVAARAANSVEVVDLNASRRSSRLQDVREPQGLAWLPARRWLVVASGGAARVDAWSDGKRVAHAEGLEDADNIRFDADAGRLYVGYASGLAVLDAATLRIVDRIALVGHAEAFELSPTGREIYVNVPSAGVVAVVDRRSGKTIASWDTGDARGNFAMALDAVNHRLFVATRRPAKLLVFDTRAGRRISSLPLCGDADDLFLDRERRQLYAICGEGVVEVIAQREADNYEVLQRVPTAAGARTGLLAPSLEALYVALPARAGRLAQVQAYRLN